MRNSWASIGSCVCVGGGRGGGGGGSVHVCARVKGRGNGRGGGHSLDYVSQVNAKPSHFKMAISKN